MLRVFPDANVYFAGCFSPEGASALVLALARHGRIRLIASRLVLREAERNLRLKAGRKTVGLFHQFLKAVKLQIVPTPDEAVLRRYEAVIHPKDVPVLAAAREYKADYLVTLDRQHFMTKTVLVHSKPVRIVTPGEFLRDVVHR